MSQLPFEKVTRDVIVKQEATSNPDYGYDPLNRPIGLLLDLGVININKPKGPTSHQCADFVQKILNIAKAGHGGSLDPLVTGVLPVALGSATRIVQTLLPAGKEYVGVMHLHKDLPEEEIRKGCEAFVGKINQMVPRKSAVKRQEREREIYYFDILEIDGKDVLFKTGVQAGTYIRKLCHDIGAALGVGAHMAELIRTKAGPFNDTDWVTLQDLEDAMWYYKNEQNEKPLRKFIKPVEFGASHLPKIWIRDSAIDTICHGAQLNLPGIARLETGIAPDDIVAVMSLKNELVALGKAKMTSEQIKTEQKGLAVKPFKVFMEPGTYPSIHKNTALDQTKTS